MCLTASAVLPREASGKGPLALPWTGCIREETVKYDVLRPEGGIRYNAVSKELEHGTHPAVNPKRAMLHSLIVPGWGQFDNGSRKKAALFFAAEMFFVGGYVYESYLAKKSDITPYVRDAYRTDRNTFVIYWFIAKVLDITDAYVDAQLAGFNVQDITPGELKPKNGTE